jgi:N-acylneuraminate cytidylyltransferase
MVSSSEVWAIIPARGGSKSIPHKNLQEVGGVPLIARAIRACMSADAIDRTIVSTDDIAIADAARLEGAEIVVRPSQISGDDAKSEDALLHAISNLKTSEGDLPGIVAFVQCTSPFIMPEDIDGTLRALEKNHCDCALTAARSHAFVWRRTPHSSAVGINHDLSKRPRRQEREEEFVETGAVYVMRTKGFLATGHRFFGKIAIHEVPRLRAMEIDEPEDLDCARVLMPWIDGRYAAARDPDSSAPIAESSPLILQRKKRISGG